MSSAKISLFESRFRYQRNVQLFFGKQNLVTTSCLISSHCKAIAFCLARNLTRTTTRRIDLIPPHHIHNASFYHRSLWRCHRFRFNQWYAFPDPNHTKIFKSLPLKSLKDESKKTVSMLTYPANSLYVCLPSIPSYLPSDITKQRIDPHPPDAAYFDYKRRNDPNFRRSLKKEKKLHAKAQKAQANAQNENQREAIHDAVRQAQVEGFPTDVEEKEAYFMGAVARGETLCAEGM
jgi:hypothetical protein